MTDKDLIFEVKLIRARELRRFDMNPKDQCGLVCTRVLLNLGDAFKMKIVSCEVMNKWHHWVLLHPDGRIIDPTASQFNNLTGKNMPDIYFGAPPDWYSFNERFWEYVRKLENG